MNNKANKLTPPARLSEEQMRKSRAGTLGRFPSEDLYAPEPDDKQPEQHRLRGIQPPNSKNEKPRSRSAAIGLE